MALCLTFVQSPKEMKTRKREFQQLSQRETWADGGGQTSIPRMGTQEREAMGFGSLRKRPHSGEGYP